MLEENNLKGDRNFELDIKLYLRGGLFKGNWVLFGRFGGMMSACDERTIFA